MRHLDFLKETGFVGDDDRLTSDGLWASQLRVDQPLLVAECLRQGLLPDKDAGPDGRGVCLHGQRKGNR